MNDKLIEVENLGFRYPLCAEKALDGVSFAIERGDFVAVAGATGSGKSTLLRMLKRELTPVGEKSGRVLYDGQELDALDARTSACKIGFVMQRPEQQLVTDRVWHELAFGMENMGIQSDAIRRRVSEMAAYFGIEEWFERDVAELSGGQKQLLNLAAVMVMQPDLLILDEPTAQLDPIAASDFISTLVKLNRELSLTVIIVEHRLEEIVPVSNRLLALDDGRILEYGDTRETVRRLCEHPRMLEGMPAVVRIFSRLKTDAPCPLDVREGRIFISSNFGDKVKSLPEHEYIHSDRPALEFSEVYFRYGRELPDILRGLSLTIYEGEIFCILGGNGAGKSTALLNAAAILRPYSGGIRVFGRKLSEYKNRSLYRDCLAMLPQDVQTVFLCNTVAEELADANAEPSELPFDLTALLDRHPYDLSGGQQQLLALAKTLATRPRLLLLDEPTKGLDAYAKKTVAETLKKLRERGLTIVAVTHDIEFAAAISDRCAMFFRGDITSCDVPRVFFAENSFYTTAVNRMTRTRYNGVITVDDAVKICELNRN